MRIKELIRPIKIKFGSDRRYLEKRYKKIFGFKPDLDDPKRFSEIINWIKLNVRNPLYTTCADKYAVRNFVRNNADEEILIPLLAYGKDWESINYSALEEPFIIKTTHSSGSVTIVRDKSVENETKIRNRVEAELKSNYYYGLREWHYKNIEPAIIVEKLLVDNEGNVPTDLKFHCFNNGDAIEIIFEPMLGRFVGTRAAFYTEAWERLPFENTYPQLGYEMQQPENFAELCRTARKLASHFRYVRVDLYSLDKRIYFGELTFTPTSGVTPFKPDKWDFFMGEKILATGMVKTT